MTVTIYHNPDCGTSRNTLAMIRQSGEEPGVIELRGRRWLGMEVLGISQVTGARSFAIRNQTETLPGRAGVSRWPKLVDEMVNAPVGTRLIPKSRCCGALGFIEPNGHSVKP
jgi:arsenate reductase-like glutaredoxin family protein